MSPTAAATTNRISIALAVLPDPETLNAQIAALNS